MSERSTTRRKTGTVARKVGGGLSTEERAAVRERAKELAKEARKGPTRNAAARQAEAEAEVLARIAEMSGSDCDMATRLHELIKSHAPMLAAKTWYGMPAYARDGEVVCFFQAAQKFKTRYASLGFTDKARLDEGGMWPTAFALAQWSSAIEARIVGLLKRAWE